MTSPWEIACTKFGARQGLDTLSAAGAGPRPLANTAGKDTPRLQRSHAYRTGSTLYSYMAISTLLCLKTPRTLPHPAAPLKYRFLLPI